MASMPQAREVARRSFFALYALQHRGQEGAGIVTCDGQMAHVHKGMGLVSQVFNEENLRYLQGHMAIGHTRYSTTGAPELRNTQPYVLETLDGPLAIGHNGNLINAPQLRRELLERGVGLADLHRQRSDHPPAGRRRRRRLADAHPHRAWPRPRAPMRLVILTADAIYGVRDPWGLRPLVLGPARMAAMCWHRKAAPSPRSAPKMIREIEPGEIVRLDAQRATRLHQGAPPQKLAFCTFEQIYFARPDSVLNGKLVHQVRQKLGRQLAKEAPVDADIVVPVPDSGTPHAIGYAQKSGIPYSEGLIKSRYIGRTFIEPTDATAQGGRGHEVQPAARESGRQARGAGRRFHRARQHLRPAGPVCCAKPAPRKCTCAWPARPSSSPVSWASIWPAQSELIAANKSLDEICAHIGADSLAFLSLTGMMKALKASRRLLQCLLHRRLSVPNADFAD